MNARLRPSRSRCRGRDALVERDGFSRVMERDGFSRVMERDGFSRVMEREGFSRASMHTTLPRRFYADPDFYRAELERFYFGRWICAGRADQIPDPGDYFTRTLAGD